MSKWRQKGGGFIGTIESVTFEPKVWESENAKDGEYTTVTAKVMVKKDGADDAVEQYLPAGFLYDGQSVSKNGKTLIDKNSDDAAIIDGDSDFARLVDTYEEAGGDVATFVKSNYRNFEALEGQRVEFKNEMNKTRQIAAGLKKLGAKRGTKANEDGTYTIKGKKVTEAEVLEAGKRLAKKGPNKGKLYNQTRLTIVKIFSGSGDEAAEEDEDEEEAEEAPKTAKGKGKGKPAPAAEPDEDEADEDEDADEGPSNKEAIKVLLAILKDEDDSVSVSDIPVLVARRVKDKAERAAMTKKLVSPDFLAEENGWSVTGTGKKMSVAID